MRRKSDTRKKRFLDALTTGGTVSHAARAAGVSRNTVYRWRIEDREFAACWDEAHENAVEAVESVLYQKALSGDTICMIFYLKAHRPQYRDKLNIDVKQLDREIEERLAELRSIVPSMRRSRVRCSTCARCREVDLSASEV
jgi:transposase-like protein